MKLTIGVTDYELKKVSEKELYEYDVDENHVTAGLCDSLQCVISIAKENHPQVRLQTFWHETVHAMLEQIGAGELSLEEDFVDAFGKQLYGLHKQNNLEKIYAFLGGEKR